MVICLERGADLHIAQLMPLPLTVCCFSKIQIGFAQSCSQYSVIQVPVQVPALESQVPVPVPMYQVQVKIPVLQFQVPVPVQVLENGT